MFRLSGVLYISNVVAGLTFWQWAIVFVCCVIYLAIILSLAWESHSKYGTGYWWVGACFAGLAIAYFNYQYWLSETVREAGEYPLWLMILINIFLGFLGLWAYLIFHAIFLKKSKAVRAGSRLERKVFAEEQASTGSGRFRDQLKGWEGDVRLDILLVEKKFDEAEDYLEGEIIKATDERDNVKIKHYQQYRAVIQKERLAAEKTSPVSSESTIRTKEVDIKRGEEIKKEDLPEGWDIPD